MMIRFVTLAVALALAGAAHADRDLSPTERDLQRELPRFGYKNVDVTKLTPTQRAHIYHLIYSDKSVSQIRGNIGAVLGDSLFDTFFSNK